MFRVGLERQVGRADNGRVAVRQYALHLDGIRPGSKLAPAGRVLVVDVAQRLFTIDDDVHGRCVGRGVKNLHGRARCRRLDRRRIVVI
jgi:hypothetical protein